MKTQVHLCMALNKYMHQLPLSYKNELECCFIMKKIRAREQQVTDRMKCIMSCYLCYRLILALLMWNTINPLNGTYSMHQILMLTEIFDTQRDLILSMPVFSQHRNLVPICSGGIERVNHNIAPIGIERVNRNIAPIGGGIERVNRNIAPILCMLHQTFSIKYII